MAAAGQASPAWNARTAGVSTATIVAPALIEIDSTSAPAARSVRPGAARDPLEGRPARRGDRPDQRHRLRPDPGRAFAHRRDRRPHQQRRPCRQRLRQPQPDRRGGRRAAVRWPGPVRHRPQGRRRPAVSAPLGAGAPPAALSVSSHGPSRPPRRRCSCWACCARHCPRRRRMPCPPTSRCRPWPLATRQPPHRAWTRPCRCPAPRANPTVTACCRAAPSGHCRVRRWAWWPRVAAALASGNACHAVLPDNGTGADSGCAATWQALRAAAGDAGVPWLHSASADSLGDSAAPMAALLFEGDGDALLQVCAQVAARDGALVRVESRNSDELHAGRGYDPAVLVPRAIHQHQYQPPQAAIRQLMTMA